MTVRALSRAAIEGELRCTGPEDFLEKNNVVSCLDTGLASPFIYSVYQTHYKSLLTLHFDDIGNPDWNHEEDGWRYHGFSGSHVTRLRNWFEQADKSKPFLVHCWAGVSRSGAIGLWLTRRLGLSEVEFFKANPQVKPNTHVLLLLNESLSFCKDVS